jgi:hypothetical protein
MHAHAHALIECVFTLVRQEKPLQTNVQITKRINLFYNGFRARTHTGTCVLRWEAAASATKRRAVCPLPALSRYLSPSHITEARDRAAHRARREPSNIAHADAQ